MPFFDLENGMTSRTEPRAPSRTALRMALQRAAHQLLDEPRVLDDPYALRILGPEALDMAADPYRYNDPMSRPLRAAIVGRSRWAEDALEQAVAHGLQRAVLLGAGLETYCLRAPPGLPITMKSLPSLVTIVGLIEESGVFLGAMALASPCTRP